MRGESGYKLKESGYKLKESVDGINEFVYNVVLNEDLIMTISEQIKILCIRCGINETELARRLGKSPQSLNSKIKRASFAIQDLDEIASVLGVKFERQFVLDNGEVV